jgi:hypothetical protein
LHEGFGAFVVGIVDDVGRLAMFDDDPVGHEHDPVGDVFGEACLGG